MACARSSPQARAPPPHLCPPTSMKATLQQPSGEADTHAVAPQWSMRDFAWGQRRPSSISASTTCPISMLQTPAQLRQLEGHPKCHSPCSVFFCTECGLPQQCFKSACQDNVQDSTPQYSIMDFAMRKPIGVAMASGVQASSMTSIQLASGGTVPPADDAFANISHTNTQTCTRLTAHDVQSFANDAAPD